MKRDNQRSLGCGERGLFSEEVLSSSEQAKHDLSYPEHLFKCYLGAARYQRFLFQVTMKPQIQNTLLSKVGSNNYI